MNAVKLLGNAERHWRRAWDFISLELGLGGPVRTERRKALETRGFVRRFARRSSASRKGGTPKGIGDTALCRPLTPN